MTTTLLSSVGDGDNDPFDLRQLHDLVAKDQDFKPDSKGLKGDLVLDEAVKVIAAQMLRIIYSEMYHLSGEKLEAKVQIALPKFIKDRQKEN